jgi:hypothetical protein
VGEVQCAITIDFTGKVNFILCFVHRGVRSAVNAVGWGFFSENAFEAVQVKDICVGLRQESYRINLFFFCHCLQAMPQLTGSSKNYSLAHVKGFAKVEN